MNNHILYYYNTDIEIKVGDKVLYKGWFLKKPATVMYVPGQSDIDKKIGVEQWQMKLDNGTELIMPHFPHFNAYADKNIIFVSRG